MNHWYMVPLPLVYGTYDCSTYLIYYKNFSWITYISDIRACYVCRKITIRATLFMHGTFHPSDFSSLMYDHCICSVSSTNNPTPSDSGA